jgi:hypothetical protein
MQLTEKIEYFTELWSLILPHVAEPSPQDAARWCDYEPAIVERAMLRTGRRFAKDKIPPGFNPEEAYRYVTGVSRSMTAELAISGVNQYAPSSTTIGEMHA